MAEEKKEINPLIIAIVIILALFIVLEACAVLIGTINTEGMPAALVAIIEACKFIFAAAPFAIAIGFGRNITGYTINWLRGKRKEEETADYSIKWLAETVTKFEGWIVLATPFVNVILLNLPFEHKALGMAVSGAFFALADMLFSEVKKIIADIRKEPG